MTDESWMSSREADQLVRYSLQDLPDELVDEVVSRLAPSHIFKLNCVCKRFLCARTEPSPSLWGRKDLTATFERELPFVLCSIQDNPNRNPLKNQVSSTSELSFLLPPVSSNSNIVLLSRRVSATNWQQFSAPLLLKLPSVQTTSRLKALSSAQGLVLLGQEFEEHEATLWVINPLTRSKREISSTLAMGYRVRQLVMDDAIDGRYLILAENNMRTAPDVDLKLLIYDSMSQQWGLGGTLRTNIRCPLIFTAAASLHGDLYCLANTQETAHLFQLDREEGCWHDLDAGVPPSLYPQKYQKFWMRNPVHTFCKPHLFRHRSDLLLAGATLYKYGTKSRWAFCTQEIHVHCNEPELDEVFGEGVHLWKLDREKRRWNYEMAMPQHLFNKDARTYEFLSSEDYLFVNQVMSKDCCSTRFFSCELSSGRWRELPPLEVWDSSSCCTASTDGGLIVYEPSVRVCR